MTELRIPVGALVVMVGPSGSGKSTWARRHLGDGRTVSSDRLRAVVSHDEHDQRASGDAFDLLDRIVAARLRRGLSTVVDSTALEEERRARYRELAATAGAPCHAVVLDLPEKEVRARNKARSRAVPAAAIAGQWRRFAEVRDRIGEEGFDAVHVVTDLATPARWVGVETAGGADAPAAAGDLPRLGLHLGRFELGDGPQGLLATARTAEEVGFDGIWVMDHLQQVPQVGRAWDDLPEAWTTLAWFAAHTERVRLGSLVTPVTLRPLAVLAKAVATTDVLSGGRVTCGIGLGWYRTEHDDLGVPFPDVDDRYALLEDHLRGLPVLWGAGQKAFHGRLVDVPKATAYPRPSQDPVPLLVGGNGPRRTLRLAAQYADAVNLQGDLAAVRRGIESLHGHLDEVGRDRAEVRVTVRADALCRPSPAAVEAACERLAPSGAPAAAWGARVGAGTVADHERRLRALADLGVDEVLLSVADPDPEGLAAFVPLLERANGA